MPVMSDDDHAQWQAIQAWKADRLAPHRAGSWWARAAGQVVGTTGDALARVPGAARAGWAVVDGVARLVDLAAGTAAASVRTGAVVEAYRERGHEVGELADVRSLPLADIRAATPRLGVRYAATGAVQSVASTLLVSGETAATVAGAAGTAGLVVVPGIGAVLATLALDAAVGVLMGDRAVAQVAAYHGYDVDDPGERLFALGVLALGLAEDSRRVVAYRELTGIASGLARRQAWALTADQAGAVARAVSTALAVRLTQERFAQLVPVLGTILAVERNVRGAARVVDDAEHLYAERLLRERYDLPLDDLELDGSGPDDDRDGSGGIAAAVEQELSVGAGR
jgi:TolB-like protein